MTDTLLLAELTIDDVRRAIRASFTRESLDTASIEDFLASVDWSGAADAETPVAKLLGQLEQWATETAEGDLSNADLLSRLKALVEADTKVREDPSPYDPDN